MCKHPLKVSGLKLQYNGTQVLGGIDLELETGELVVVLGVSGSGKTTLLRAIAGLVTPDSGSIRVGEVEVFRDGQDLVPVEKRRVGFVFQDYALFPSMNVVDNVRFGLPSDASASRSDEVLELVGMAGFRDRLPSKLSGGQQQRVAMARSIAPRPSLLLLDEPFANVDLSRRRLLGQELRETLSNEGVASLMVTHDPDTAMRLADRLAVLVVANPSGARVAQYGRSEQVYRQPVNREIAELLGPAAFVRAMASGFQATCPLGRVELLNACSGEVDLLVRPEDVAFSPGPGQASVRSATFVGRGYRLAVDTAAGTLEVDSPNSIVGAQGGLSFKRPLWAMSLTAT